MKLGRIVFLLFTFALATCAPPTQTSTNEADSHAQLREASIREVAGLARLNAITYGGEYIRSDALKYARIRLKDPDSAQFRNVRVVDVEEGILVCGEVNGKNSYGKYAGFVLFISGLTVKIYKPSSDPIYERAFNAGLMNACSYDWTPLRTEGGQLGPWKN